MEVKNKMLQFEGEKQSLKAPRKLFSVLLICTSLLLVSIVTAEEQPPPQARVGGLEPGDYVDEAGELDVMASQQQIPTAQIMSAAGHLVPENFFLPGGSIPAIYSPRYPHQQTQNQQHQQQQQQQQSQQQAAALHQHQLQIQEAQQALRDAVQARHLSPLAAAKFARQIDLMSAASEQHGPDMAQLIEYNTYREPEPGARDPNARDLSGGMDLAEYMGPAASAYEQQQHYDQQLAANQQDLAMVLAGHHQQIGADQMAQAASETNEPQYSNQVGPAYQISEGGYGPVQQHNYHQAGAFGLPTKSSSKEPVGLLKPLGNPKTVSSPIIDFAQQLPKTSQFEKLAEKLPQHQTPTVFSFSSAKDPVDKAKGARQKKTTMIKQAEQLARAMIKAVNEKFGTNLGDQSDLPFLLSSIGPLGIAQNLLFDPTLLVTLLNSAEKTYFADVLPAPAKMAMRPMLNIFRVPNKKRDKANLLNIISYLASGGQTSGQHTSAKHRAFGVEKQSVNGKSRVSS